MGIRITQMDPLQDVLKRDDLFEMARPSGSGSGASFSVTAEQIAAYYKRSGNGSFYGTTTKSLDEFTYTDAGTYYWQGTPALTGMPSAGILEVLAYVNADDISGGETPAIFERLTAGDQCFIRSQLGGMWSSWGVLTNKNGNVIFSGSSSADEVVFPVPFSVAPVVTLTPVNADPNNFVNVINLHTVNTNKFTVVRYQCSLGDYIETETVHTTEQSGTTTTKTVTRETTGYAWSAGSFGYYWTATLDG